MTSAMTIHIVSSVELMLGWNVTRSAALGAVSGAKSITVCGAGNSRLLSMKQAGKAQVSPGDPPVGNGGKATNAMTSRAMTAAIRSSQRDDGRRRGFAGGVDAGVSATGSDATCSLYTLPPHTGARPVAALCLGIDGPEGPT
jgi:hypothetical protein